MSRTVLKPGTVPLASCACSSAIWRCRILSRMLRYSLARMAAASNWNTFCCCWRMPWAAAYCWGRVNVNSGPSWRCTSGSGGKGAEMTYTTAMRRPLFASAMYIQSSCSEISIQQLMLHKLFLSGAVRALHCRKGDHRGCWGDQWGRGWCTRGGNGGRLLQLWGSGDHQLWLGRGRCCCLARPGYCGGGCQLDSWRLNSWCHRSCGLLWLARPLQRRRFDGLQQMCWQFLPVLQAVNEHLSVREVQQGRDVWACLPQPLMRSTRTRMEVWRN